MIPLLNNDTQSVNTCDSSPDEMQTPEEFKAKVWRLSLEGPGLWLLAAKLKARSGRESLVCFTSNQAAINAIALEQVHGLALECDLSERLAKAEFYQKDLVLLDEALIEIDCWEYKP